MSIHNLNTKYYYDMFGLHVCSDISFNIPESPAHEHDLNIVLQDTIANSFKDKDIQWEIDKSKTEVTLSFIDVGRYVIQGDTIHIYPFEMCDEKAMVLYLTGTVIGSFLLLNKKFSIHGSTANINQKAYIFSGESGAGKSSIARGFMHKGYSILSDDISLLKKDLDYHVIPSYPSQKLWNDTVNMFSLTTNDNMKITNREDKYSMDISHQFHPTPLPLGGIFFIKIKHGQPSISEAQHSLKLECLLNNVYLDDLIVYYELEKDLLITMADLAPKIPVYILTRPPNINTIEEQTQLVMNTLQTL